MLRGYRHLTHRERCQIHATGKAGFRIRSIPQRGRSPDTPKDPRGDPGRVSGDSLSGRRVEVATVRSSPRAGRGEGPTAGLADYLDCEGAGTNWDGFRSHQAGESCREPLETS